MDVGKIEQLTTIAKTPAPDRVTVIASGWKRVDRADLRPIDKCQHCNERPATQTWVGEGGAFAYVHGAYQFWCKVCVLTAQLEHARKMAESIPAIEQELAAALKAWGDGTP